MKIYTKTGDTGETGLFGGKRVTKDSPRIEAYGTVDELNAFIGLAITEVNNPDVKKILEKIQNQLFIVGADLATPENEKNKIQRVTSEFYIEAEIAIDNFELESRGIKKFHCTRRFKISSTFTCLQNNLQKSRKTGCGIKTDC